MREQILEQHWKEIDQLLTNYLSKHKILTTIMKDEIQGIFDSIKWRFNDAMQPISIRDKQKLIRMYGEWQKEEIMTKSFNNKAKKTISRKNISHLEMISLMIEAAYLRRDKELNEEKLFSNIAAVSGTTLTFADANQITTYGSPPTANNDVIIPMYVIGYDTGMF